MDMRFDDLAAMATNALREGRMADAARFLEAIVGQVPDPANWFNLGIARRGARDFDGALDAYARATSFGGAVAADALVNRAVMLKDDLNRVAEAEADLARAIELSPRSIPAWYNLGLLHEATGKKEEARSAYQHAVAVEPLNAAAHARLATLDDDPQRGIARIVQLLRRGKFGQPDAATLEFALAQALDRAERYDEAFAVVTRANERKARICRPEFRNDRRRHEGFVDALIAAFPVAPRSSDPGGDLRPVFICGLFRSGSTVTEQWLARHPAIVAGGELETIPALVGGAIANYPAGVSRLSPAQVQELRTGYLDLLRRIAPGARNVTDKLCDNFLHLGLIKTLFSDAPIVHTVRDPLDVAISTYFLEFAEPMAYTNSLADIAHYVGQYRRIMRHWEAVFGSDIVTVRYEDLVADPQAALAPAFARLGLSAEFAGTVGEGAIRTPSAWAARAPLHARSVGRWRHYARHLEPLVAQLQA